MGGGGGAAPEGEVRSGGGELRPPPPPPIPRDKVSVPTADGGWARRKIPRPPSRAAAWLRVRTDPAGEGPRVKMRVPRTALRGGGRDPRAGGRWRWVPGSAAPRQPPPPWTNSLRSASWAGGLTQPAVVQPSQRPEPTVWSWVPAGHTFSLWAGSADTSEFDSRGDPAPERSVPKPVNQHPGGRSRDLKKSNPHSHLHPGTLKASPTPAPLGSRHPLSRPQGVRLPLLEPESAACH